MCGAGARVYAYADACLDARAQLEATRELLLVAQQEKASQSANGERGTSSSS